MKYLIAFLVGAAAGTVGTYLYFTNKVEKMVKDTVNEEIDKFFERQTQVMAEEDVEEVPDKEEPKVSDVPDTTEKSSIVKMEETIRTNYRDNDGIEEDEDDDEEYITDEEMSILLEESRKRMEEGPHFITEEEETTTCIGYDNVEYIWYPDSNIITDALDNETDEKDILDILFKPIDWRKELKDKDKIIIRVPEEATNYTVWNHDKAGW